MTCRSRCPNRLARSVLAVSLVPWLQSTPLDSGIALFWDGRYEEALAVLSPFCSTEIPRDHRLECLKHVALSHIALEERQGAETAFVEILSLDPDYRFDESLVAPKVIQQFETSKGNLVARLFTEGKAAYFDRKYELAERTMTRILQLDPEHELAREYSKLSAEQVALVEKAASLAGTEGKAELPQNENPSADATVDLNRVHHYTSEMTRPVLVRNIEPRYPEIAFRAGQEAVVVLFIVIDKYGRVQDPRVIRSGGTLFDQAALQAVRQWRYQPARLGGEPVAIYSVVRLSFELSP